MSERVNQQGLLSAPPLPQLTHAPPHPTRPRSSEQGLPPWGRCGAVRSGTLGTAS